MKIDGKAPHANVSQAPRIEESKPRVTGEAAGSASAAAHGDSVELSPRARLAGRALQAASAGPETNADKVAGARAKLAAGEVGADAARLADRMIDHLLEI